jgi:UDP-N-acetylmuramoyl-tripeptide--D-alanyl-D-alanine ligase
MGTSESGEIAILNNQVKPDIAAITNVSIGHLDGLRDTESIAREKGNILNFYNDNGVAVLPKDSVFFDFWSKKTNAKEIITFGFQENSDFKVSDIEIDFINNFTNFYLRFDGKKEKFFINGASRHSPLNAALSVAAAIYCGCPLSNIKKRLKFIDLPERRLAISNSLKGSILIDDSYNSNPASLKNAVDSLEGLKRKKFVS